MKNRLGRLGSWESEKNLGSLFSGWFGQTAEDLEASDEEEEDESQEAYQDSDTTEAGGQESITEVEQAHDIGPAYEKAEIKASAISSDILSPYAGAANINNYIPGSFLRQHPFLKRYLPKDSSDTLGNFDFFDSKNFWLLLGVAVVIILLCKKK